MHVEREKALSLANGCSSREVLERWLAQRKFFPIL